MRRTKLFSAALLAAAWLAGGSAWAQFDAEKVYTIQNFKDDNGQPFMQDNGTGLVVLDNKNDNSYWKFIATANADCYYIQNATTGKYIQGYNAVEQEVATGDAGVEYYVKADANGTYSGMYRMSCVTNNPHDFSNGTWGLNWKGTIPGTVQSFASVAGGNPRSAWIVTESDMPNPGPEPEPDPAHVHDYSNNGICTCDGDEKYQPAEMVDGVYMLGNVGNVEWMSAKVGAGLSNEEETPYAICSYKLTGNIDYAGLPVNTHKPIGTFDKKFLGVFDGDGHSIKNMKLDQPERPRPGDDGIGFFGCVRVGNDKIASVVIKNLTIDSSCEVKGSSAFVAGIVGRIHERTQDNTLLIENCVNKANVTTSANHVAGIVGQITAINDKNVTITIKNCTNEGAITTSGAYAAGIVAQINSAASSTVNILGCINKGAVQTAGLCAAGIVSQANNCTVALNIESCMNFADVTSTGNKNCGGIHGANTSSKAIIRMINCGNMGNVSATTESAALTGWIGSNSGNVITNCWNFGSVTGISNSDNTYRGTVTATNVYDKNGGQGIAITDDMLTSGELCYRLNGDQSVVAWTQTLDGTQDYPLPADGDKVFAHGQIYCDGTSAPGTLYNNDGPDGIVQIPHDISDEIGMCTFCHTQFQEPALVDGYYEIKNAGNLEWFSNKVDEGGDANLQINGKLMNDIDLLNIENLHKPIGQTTGKKYNGTFDGQGFRIKNMIIERPNDSNIGFFGFLRGNAANTTVKNLIMDASCTIHGYNRVGAITGSCQNSSDFTITLENIINEATVIAEHQDAAAIIGGQEGNGPKWLIRNVLNLGTVTAKNEHPYAGALCCYLGGNSQSVIENFVNLGTINGHEGGNIGRIAGTYTNIIDLSDTDPAGSTASPNIGFETGLEKTDIAGGKLAYTVGWWQELGVDAYPTPFEKAGAVVYRTGEERCDGADSEGTVYSNTEGTIVTGSHNYNATTGFCDLCGQPNPDFKTLVDGAYELASVIDVKWFEAMVNNGNPAINGKMTVDALDFEGGSCRIGTDANSYRGTFQGNGVVVSNFVINNAEAAQGFFGWVTGGADISGIVFDNTCSISCNERAGIIGAAKDGGTVKITRLGNEGNVTTTSRNAAGIIGTDLNSACTLLIDQCYSTGAIKGGNESAQIAGWTGSTSKITNSWSCASVEGIQSGRPFSRYGGDNHDAQFENCFSTMTENNAGLTFDVPAEKFVSGEVAYALNTAAGKQCFGQFIGIDEHPVFDGSEVSYIGEAGYATLYDTTTGYVLNGDVTAYVAVLNTKWLDLTEIKNVPESTPVILKGGYYNKFAYDVPAINIANDLKGADADTAADGTMYILAKVDDKVGFYKAEGTIPAGKAYYQSTSGVKAFFFDGDEATGIEMVNGQSSMVNGQSIYNVAGQKLTKMQKGINIVGGKKVMK